MDPIRFGDENKIRLDAIVAFLFGTLVAHLLLRILGQPSAGRGWGVIFTAIVVGVGGAWYHFRKLT